MQRTNTQKYWVWYRYSKEQIQRNIEKASERKREIEREREEERLKCNKGRWHEWNKDKQKLKKIKENFERKKSMQKGIVKKRQKKQGTNTQKFWDWYKESKGQIHRKVEKDWEGEGEKD